MITKRSKPLVRIDPIENVKNGVWDLARKFKKVNGPIKEDLELPPSRNVYKEKSFLD
ncbi:MAG: hypothetical protein GY777_32835 [Candidatus Brocadiaceae bacterium]|nr:hypothetical protein [Candidatus Brocadiaceae bacterium]